MDDALADLAKTCTYRRRGYTGHSNRSAAPDRRQPGACTRYRGYHSERTTQGQREIRSLTAQQSFLGNAAWGDAVPACRRSLRYQSHLYRAYLRLGMGALYAGGAVALSLIGMLIMRRISAIDV